MTKYIQSFFDKRGKIIATYDPEVEGSVTQVYDRINLAYEGGQLTEGKYLSFVKNLTKLGLEPDLKDRQEINNLEKIARNLAQKSRKEVA